MDLEKYFKEYATADIQEYKKLLIREVTKKQNTIICKARQIGMSTLFLSYLAFLFEVEKKDIFIISHNPKSSLRIFKSFLKNQEHKNLSRMFASELPEHEIKHDVIFVDEMCFLREDKKDFSKLKAKEKIILCSTPRMKEGNFYKIWSSSAYDETWEKAYLPYTVNENFIFNSPIDERHYTIETIITEFYAKFLDVRNKNA